MNNQVLVGTAKGLLIYTINLAGDMIFQCVHFLGFSVNMIYVDERTNRWWAGVSHKHWGQKLHFSDNEGEKWYETTSPSFDGKLLQDGSRVRLRQIWCMSHGGEDEPGRLWLGTDPGGLFMSIDNGETFQLVKKLWDHPSRKNREEWFGAGSDYPFIHSIVVNPDNTNHVYIAASSAGVFESTDGGSNWHPKNKGLVATYLPDQNVDVGHDPHHLLMSTKDTSILWQQNHCGVFNTINGGATWNDVSGKIGIPHYGFALTIDEENPERAWVIPVESDELRIPPDLKLNVFETEDFGKNWRSQSEGLPQLNTFDIVLRQGFVRKDNLFVFGTTNGNLYYSTGEKIHWKTASSSLTKVSSVYIK